MRIDDNNYVDKAESVIKGLSIMTDKSGNKKKAQMIKTSKIRNLLAMVSDIYNDVLNLTGDKLPEEIVGRISYMRMKFYYEAGREKQVKELFEKSEVLEILKEIGTSKANYMIFSRYMESLVAFRKFYGDKDD